MKKLFFCIFLVGCNGHHLRWVDETKPEVKLSAPILKDNLGGVVFTFDDGPDLQKTPKVLDILKKYNLQATFFVEGINLDGRSERANERRELLVKMSNDGHIIANHTYNHSILSSLAPQKIEWEIDSTTKLIENTINKKVELIRLPYGRYNKKVNSVLASRHLTSVFWDIDLREWDRHKTKEVVFNDFIELYTKLHDDQGQKKIILLLHDTKEITTEVLPLILDYLSKK